MRMLCASAILVVRMSATGVSPVRAVTLRCNWRVLMPNCSARQATLRSFPSFTASSIAVLACFMKWSCGISTLMDVSSGSCSYFLRSTSLCFIRLLMRSSSSSVLKGLGR